jgi:hypothetical protein
MNLMELLGVKKMYQMTRQDIDKFLEGSEFKPVGEGGNASVFLKGDTIYKFWLRDEAYEKFLEYVLKHQHNPYLPRLKSGIKELPTFHRRHLSAPDRLRYVKMEELENKSESKRGTYQNLYLFKKKSRDIYISERKVLDIFYIDIDKGMSREQLYRAVLDGVEHYAKKQLEIRYDDEDDEDLSELERQLDLFDTEKIDNPELLLLIDTLCDIYELVGKDKHVRFDLHDWNVLFRGKQMVIVDPLVSDKNLRFNQMLYRYEEELRKDMKDHREVTGPKR